MRLLRSFPILAFSLVLLSIAAVCAAQQSVGLLLIAGTLAAISWYVTEGPRGRVLPRWVSNLLIIAISMNVFYELLRQQDEVLAVLGRFGVWLTIIKLYERRTARDYAHLLTLSLVLVMTAVLGASGLLVGMTLIVYSALGLYVLLMFQLYAAFERARDERQAIPPPDQRLVPPLKPIMGRHPLLRFRGQAVGIAALAIAISLGVFIVFPRDIGANMFHLADAGPSVGNTGARVTQFAWTIDLNVGGRITESTRKVMSVSVFGGGGAMGEPLRLRGAALNEYAGQGRWNSAIRQRLPLRESSAPANRQLSPNAMVQRIVLERHIDGTAPIFSTYAPIAVVIENEPITAENAGQLMSAPELAFPSFLTYDPFTQTLRTNDAARGLRSYVVVADPAPPLEVAQSRADPARPVEPRRWFAPRDMAVLRELADRQLAAAGIDLMPPGDSGIWRWNRDVAALLTAWLWSDEFTYTTDLSDVVYSSPQTDPIIAFLTANRRGHCEYFASALAALCHSKGVPARVIVGYLGLDYDQSLQEYTIQERHAHAWVEVATGEAGGRGWTTFDPTPAAPLLAQHQASVGAQDADRQRPSLTNQLRQTFARWEMMWQQTIVEFNSSVQAHLSESLARRWSGRMAAVLESVREWMRRVNQSFYLGPAGYIWMGIVLLALGIAVVALIKLMRRSLAIRRTLQLQHVRGLDYQRMLRHLGFYLDMLKVLHRAGIAKPPWQPPLEFAASLETSVRSGARPAQAIGDSAVPLIRRLTAMFYAARYGGRRLGRHESREAEQLVKELAAELRVRI